MKKLLFVSPSLFLLVACTAKSNVKATVDGKPATCVVVQEYSRGQDPIKSIDCHVLP